MGIIVHDINSNNLSRLPPKRLSTLLKDGQRMISSLTSACLKPGASARSSVMFEFECQGTIDNEPYQGRIVIALDVSGDKISGFREYFGDVED